MANVLYEERTVRSIAESLRLKRNGETNTYTISEMNDGVLNLPMGNIPSYHYKEAGRVVKRLLELKAQFPNNIIFGTIGDNHINSAVESTMTSARHAVYALESIGSMVCDFVVNLGDNISETNIDDEANYTVATYMENAIRYALSSLLSFNLVGNHEKSNSTQKLYDLIGKYNTFDDYGTIQIRGFGLKDFIEKKVRVICLNTCDYWNTQGGGWNVLRTKRLFHESFGFI